jgi:hypothetical protein
MSSEVPVAEGTSVVTGQRSALRRSALRAVRRDTAVTAESAWCSAFAVRVDGSRRPAASARRWTSARVSGRAMASSSHVRRRLEKNAHMLRVPSSSLCKVPRRYPHCPGLTTSRAVWQLAGAGNGSPRLPCGGIQLVPAAGCTVIFRQADSVKPGTDQLRFGGVCCCR